MLGVKNDNKTLSQKHILKKYELKLINVLCKESNELSKGSRGLPESVQTFPNHCCLIGGSKTSKRSLS